MTHAEAQAACPVERLLGVASELFEAALERGDMEAVEKFSAIMGRAGMSEELARYHSDDCDAGYREEAARAIGEASS